MQVAIYITCYLQNYNLNTVCLRSSYIQTVTVHVDSFPDPHSVLTTSSGEYRNHMEGAHSYCNKLLLVMYWVFSPHLPSIPSQTTVKPLITDPPKSGQPLYNGRVTCPRLILP